MNTVMEPHNLKEENVPTALGRWSESIYAWAIQQPTVTKEKINSYVLSSIPSEIPLDDSFGIARDLVLKNVLTKLQANGFTVKESIQDVSQTFVKPLQQHMHQETRTILSLPEIPQATQKHQESLDDTPTKKETILAKNELPDEVERLLTGVIDEVPDDFATSELAQIEEVFHQVLGRKGHDIADMTVDYSEEDGTFDLSEMDIPEGLELPTTADPGSEKKVHILAGRYAAGLPLWHPEDKTFLAPRLREKDPEEEQE